MQINNCAENLEAVRTWDYSRERGETGLTSKRSTLGGFATDMIQVLRTMMALVWCSQSILSEVSFLNFSSALYAVEAVASGDWGVREDSRG